MTEKLEINILGKLLRVTAPSAHELNNLHAAVRALNEKMHEIRAQHQAMSTEKIAIMAALNTMHDLLSLQTELEERLNRMQQLVDV